MAKHLLQTMIERSGFRAVAYVGRGVYGAVRNRGIWGDACLGVDMTDITLGRFLCGVFQGHFGTEGGHPSEEEKEVFENALGSMQIEPENNVVYFPGVPFTSGG